MVGHSMGRGVATGVYGYIYPQKSVQVNFLWGRNDVRTANEHEFEGLYLPKKFYTPKQIAGYAPVHGLSATYRYIVNGTAL